MTGRHKEVSDDDLLRLFLKHDEPILGTGDVVDEFEYSQQGAKKRLDDLESEGLLQSKCLNNAMAYWITRRGVEHLRSRDELPEDYP